MATEETAAAQASANRASEGGKKRRLRLRGFSPDQREMLARWIESKYSAAPSVIAKLEGWLRGHPDDLGSRHELFVWRGALAASRQLAHLARTELA